MLGSKDGLDVRRVQRALEEITRRNGRIFAVLVAMISALFLLCIAALIWWSSDPAKAAALISASGISLPFLLRFMRDSWRTKVQTDTLLVLASTLEPGAVRQVLKAFLARHDVGRHQ